ncbi:MAG: winged helix-turn-helix domain-containing protein [Proteobacteria bacterium]|nr:winged helix-turn-helix domain-containing protein [Pseudomonadota bacterium]MCH8951838.1 winged helix-turn-helix domain-containing protein [Pseudomonadota bacterium]
MADTRGLVHFASDPAFAIDRELRITAWNSGAQALLGHAPDEVVGCHCYDVLHGMLSGGEPLCMPGCEGIECFQRGRPFAVPGCKLRHKDGRWVSATVGTLVMPGDGEDRPDGEVAIVFMREIDAVPSRQQPAPPLRIFTLGHFGLAVEGGALATDKWRRKQALTLLKYLVIYQGRPVRRERLCDCLWPEADEADSWGRLKVTMSFLRRQLRAAGLHEDVLETIGKSYMLRRDAVWVDAVAFEGLVSDAATAEREDRTQVAVRLYEDARRLYRGDYLEEDLYADWCAEERQRLREVYLEMLAGLADCYAASGRLAEAAQVCRTALCCDPCRESFLRSVLRHLVALGRPDWAEADYRHWRRVMADEMGMELTAETEKLYRELVSGGEAAARKA